MQNELLSEIQGLKAVITRLIGTSDLPPEQQFSREALDKAAKQFQKIIIERGEWVEDRDICRYIKNSSYQAGTFIRQEFGFTNYFKRGHTYYYNKKDLIALGKELKDRNINLGRYIEYIHDLAKFKKNIADAAENKNRKRKKKSFQLPYNLGDITTSPPKMPSATIISEDIKRLKEEFFQHNLSDYIDIYRDTYAMMKSIYHLQKYLDPELKKRSKKWCENFNYANYALEVVTKKKEKFVPFREEDMIQL